MVCWSKWILDPTLALNRAQLGFRIQVGAECGNMDNQISELPERYTRLSPPSPSAIVN